MVRSGRAAAVGALLAVLLAGCTAAPRTAPSTPPQSVPAFPRIGGRTLEADSPVGGDWRIRVAVRDVDDAYGRARALLTEAGFVLTKDRDSGIGGDGQACTQRLCVNVTATDDSRWGPNLLYEAFAPSGIVG